MITIETEPLPFSDFDDAFFYDDISFCPDEKCNRRDCMRCQLNIRDKSRPHSFFVEIPEDCPKRKSQ